MDVNFEGNGTWVHTFYCRENAKLYNPVGLLGNVVGLCVLFGVCCVSIVRVCHVSVVGLESCDGGVIVCGGRAGCLLCAWYECGMFVWVTFAGWFL